MTKPTSDQAAFIELRAQGLSYVAISEKINVSKPTLLGWANEFNELIKEQRACELQALLDRYKVAKMARVDTFAKLMSAVQGEIDGVIKDKQLSSIPADKLMAMALTLDKRLQEEVSNNALQVGGMNFTDKALQGVQVELD
jgi:orotate phosphoribosyltransferase-like protein